MSKDMNMKFGFYNLTNMTINKLRFTEQGSDIRIHESGGLYSFGWLLGKNDNFQQNGCYDVVTDEGLRTLHWDHLSAAIIPTVQHWKPV